MPQTWIEAPTQAEVLDPRNWVAVSRDERALIRCLFLVDDREDPAPAVNGPEQLTLNQPPGVDYVLSKRRLIEVTRTANLEDFLQLSVSEGQVNEYATRADARLTAETMLRLRAQITKRIAHDLSIVAQRSLRRNEQYSVRLTEQLGQSINIGHVRVGSARQLHLVLMLKKRRVRVWLYRCETAVVRISRKFGILWFERKVERSSWLPRVPCFEVEYYVPQEILSVHEGAYSPTVADPEWVKVATLNSSCPRASKVPPQVLAKLAELAFPVNRLAELKAKAPVKKATKTTSVKNIARPGAKKSATSVRPQGSSARKRTP